MINEKASKIEHKLLSDEENRTDVGFGTQINDPATRLLNQDGSFNVKRVGWKFRDRLNIFNRLIVCSWTKFISLILCFFFITNLIFAFLFELAGVENLAGINNTSYVTRFWDAFFFSAQTLTTVGYGRIAPVGNLTSAIAAIESLMGLLIFALFTGLLYGRFSRPVARIKFSENALITPYLDMTGFMFRIVNERANQLINLRAEIILSIIEYKADGSPRRKYIALNLERDKVNFFPTNWTIVHPITENSPIFGMTKADLQSRKAEFLILISGTEDTFNQKVYSNNSYNADEIGAGTIHLDLRKLSDTYTVKK
ncbi:MAG: potassium transporter [Pseudarcicella sp.]|nr:potassium transporter [Pseudarcicella sp.]